MRCMTAGIIRTLQGTAEMQYGYASHSDANLIPRDSHTIIGVPFTMWNCWEEEAID